MKKLKVYSVVARFEVEVEADSEKEARLIGKRSLAKYPERIDWNVNLDWDIEYIEKGGDK